jgi:hypothetical protein
MFAGAKCWHGLRRFRLKRLEKVNGEALLIAAGQNIKRLITFGGRKPKAPAQAAALRPPENSGSDLRHVREHRSRPSWRPRRPFLNTPHDYQHSFEPELLIMRCPGPRNCRKELLITGE